jgi:DNA-binding XRE family transcriptional regulator
MDYGSNTTPFGIVCQFSFSGRSPRLDHITGELPMLPFSALRPEIQRHCTYFSLSKKISLVNFFLTAFVTYVTGDYMMKKDDIVKLRRSMNLTQEEFARRLGVHRVAVARWETGKFKPSALAMAQIERLKAKKKSRKKGGE